MSRELKTKTRSIRFKPSDLELLDRLAAILGVSANEAVRLAVLALARRKLK